MLAAHGANNVYESVTPLIFDGKYKPGLVRDVYRSLASLAGYEDDTGDLLYSASDLTLSIYASFRTPTLVENSSRLISRGFMEQPGTIKLFRYIHKDFSPKYNTANKPMKVYMIGSSAKKVYAEFKDQNYLLGDK